MAKVRAVWGIDVGHSALKALKLVVNEQDDVEVVGEDYIEHAKILSQPDADPHELISKSLEKFLSRNDITEDNVAIGVPGQHTLARLGNTRISFTITIPLVTEIFASTLGRISKVPRLSVKP